MTASAAAAAIGLAPRLWKVGAAVVVLCVTVGACVLTAVASALTGMSVGSLSAPTGIAADRHAVVTFAHQQLGQPYLWGGEGSGGFDCSGLVQAAYAAGGFAMPRVAQDQFDFGARLPTNATPEPGDLVFFGDSTTAVDHVGIVVAPGQMIDAPHAGAPVRIESYRWSNYLGATRPGGGGDGSPA